MRGWIALSCLLALPALGQTPPMPPDAKASDAKASDAKKPDAKDAPPPASKRSSRDPKSKNPPLPTKIDDLNAQPEYKVGVGDVLGINVWREPEVSGSVQIRGDCRITLNLIKDVEVCNMTPTQIQDLLVEKLGKFIAAPDVTVTYIGVNSRKVWMIGNVKRSGPISLNGPLTIADALSDAGGVAEFANDKSIKILHLDGTTTIFNYRNFLKGTSNEGNVLLQPGDRVIVK